MSGCLIATSNAPFDNLSRGKEQQLAVCLAATASANHRGVITTLPSKPFKTIGGQVFVQLDAAVVAGPTLYVGEHKNVLSDMSVLDMLEKLEKIRAARTAGASPDLAAALQGVTHVKAYLAGEVVREGLTVQEVVDAAANSDVSVVLPSAQGLEVVGNAPAMRL